MTKKGDTDHKYKRGWSEWEGVKVHVDSTKPYVFYIIFFAINNMKNQPFKTITINLRSLINTLKLYI